MTALLTLDRVAGARGGRMLFEEVSLALRPGDAALVRGPNGAGKTTLLRIVAGLLAPAAGRVEAPDTLSWVSEANALDGGATLRQALLFWARIGGGDAVRRVDAATEAVGLSALGDMPVRLLSTGQRRRAALARTVASGATAWVLDEPGNGLDPESVKRLEGVIAAHRANGGVAIVATHLPLALPGAVPVVLGGAA